MELGTEVQFHIVQAHAFLDQSSQTLIGEQSPRAPVKMHNLTQPVWDGSELLSY